MTFKGGNYMCLFIYLIYQDKQQLVPSLLGPSRQAGALLDLYMFLLLFLYNTGGGSGLDAVYSPGDARYA